MLVYADIGGGISQVGPSHAPGTQTTISGRFAIPLPPGVEIPVGASAHLQPRDGKDVVSAAFSELARRLPGVSGFYVNPLLVAEDVAALDFGGVLVDDSAKPARRLPARFGSGREPGTGAGMLGCSTFLPPANKSTSPARPGLLVTKPIVLTPYLPRCAGKVSYPDSIRVYWQLQRLEATVDASSGLGTVSGEVVGQKVLTELSHAPAGFSAYLSTDGKSFCEVGLLDQVRTCDALDRVVLAFRNDGDQRVNLAYFGLFF